MKLHTKEAHYMKMCMKKNYCSPTPFTLSLLNLYFSQDFVAEIYLHEAIAWPDLFWQGATEKLHSENCQLQTNCSELKACMSRDRIKINVDQDICFCLLLYSDLKWQSTT